MEPVAKSTAFVPPAFQVPESLETDGMVFLKLCPLYLELDYEAVMSSIDHLRRSPTPPLCGTGRLEI